MHGTSGNFMRPSKENKRQDMLSYDTFLGLSHLHALFETLHVLYKVLAKRFKFVTTFKQAALTYDPGNIILVEI